jgi:hypothetical protein
VRCGRGGWYWGERCKDQAVMRLWRERIGLHDWGPDRAQAATMACAVEACHVEAADALSGVRTRGETACRVQAAWHRQPVALPAG